MVFAKAACDSPFSDLWARGQGFPIDTLYVRFSSFKWLSTDVNCGDVLYRGATMKFNRLIATFSVLISLHAMAQERWLIGQSVPLSGGNAKFGTDIRDAAAAYFAMLNAGGGIAGRKIELHSIDDKNDRKLAGANTKKLLEDKSLLALFGYGSATLSLDSLPLAEAAGVPFFAPFSGANAVRGNSPVLFTMRASYAEEMDKMLSSPEPRVLAREGLRAAVGRGPLGNFQDGRGVCPRRQDRSERR